MLTNSTSLLRRFFVTIAIVTALSTPAFGSTRTWTTGAGTASMNTGTNWTAALPVSGDGWVFGATTGATTLSDNLTTGTASWNVAIITFSAGAAQYTINSTAGSGFTLTGTITNSTTSGTETINDPFALSAARIVTGATGSTTVLGGAISGAFTLTESSTGTVDFANSGSSFSGATPSTVDGVTYTVGVVGTTAGSIIQVGASTSGSTGPLGTGAVTLTGGTFQAVGGAQSIANNLVVEGNETFGGTGSSNLTVTGAFIETSGTGISYTVNTSSLTLAGGLQMRNTTGARTATFAGNAPIIINSVVSNSANNAVAGAVGSVLYTGTGSLTLSGANIYTGTTAVGQGSLIAGGNSTGTNASTTGTTGNASTSITGVSSFTGVAVGESITGANIAANTTIASFNAVAGTITLNQATTAVAGTTGAALTVGQSGAFGDSQTGGAVTLGSTTAGLTGAAAVLTNAGSITIGRAITETSAYLNSSLSVGGNQTSGTSIYTGTITLASGSTATSDILTSAGSGGEVGGTVNFNDVIQNGTGTQSVIIGGGGIVQLSGVNTFGSATANANSITIQGGTTLVTPGATLSSSTNFGKAGNELIFNNGIYQYNAGGTAIDLSATRTLDFASGGATIDTNGLGVTFGSAVGNSDTGGLTLADSNATTGTLTLTGPNTYQGGTTVGLASFDGKTNVGGTLVVSGSGTLGGPNGSSVYGPLAVNTNGNLDLSGTSQTVGNLSGTGGNIYNNGSGASTLNVGSGNAGSGSFAGVIKNNTGSGGTVALTKTGTGAISLTGANTYTGATQISAGTLNLGSTGSLGGTAVTISGGTLQFGALNNAATTTIGTSSLGSVALNSGGTLTFANGVANAASSTVNALDITNASSTALSFGGGGTLNIGVGGSGGSDEIVLGSAGTGTASVTGSTTINVNVLTALNGATQQLIAWNALPTGITSSTFTTSATTLNGVGSGIYTLGLVYNSSGLFLTESSTTTAYWTGLTNTVWNANLPNGGSPTSNFSSTSDGLTNRQAALDSQTSVVFTAANGTNNTNYQSTTLGIDTTIASLTYNVSGVGIGGANTLTINGGITTGSSETENISANVGLGGVQTWTVGSGSTLTVGGAISGGSGNNLTVAGTGTLVLSGTNTYTGTTTVGSSGSASILNIQGSNALNGTPGVTVNSGATLQLQGAGAITGTPTLTLNGTGISSKGALENVSGTNTFAGSIALGSAASIGADTGSSLNLTGASITSGSSFGLTLTGGGNGYLYNVIGAGISSLTMSGAGTWDIEAYNNSYAGTTTVNSGILQLGYYDSTAPASPTGFLGSTSNTLTVNTGGTLDLDGWNLTVGNLTGTGGTITNSGAVQVGPGSPFPSTLTINGSTNGSYAGSIANGDAGAGILSLTQQGPGTQTLTGSNSYTGATLITGGALKIAGSGALSPATSVTVSSGAALQLSGGISAGATLLTLTGAGVTATPNGALENVSGSNTYNSPITLAGATSIGSDAGLLTLSSTATVGGSGQNLTLVGAGNGAIASVIGTSGGTLTMSGTGTWTLSGANTYTGATYVGSGTLAYNAPGALNNSSAINLGSTAGGATATAVNLTYTGSAGTLTPTLNFTGTTGTVTLGNTGSGAIVYGAPNFSGVGAKQLTLGNTTDSVGGSIGTITNASGGGAVNVVKAGLTNSTWVLTGTGGTANTYTGTTQITGGVLQTTTFADLSNTYVNLNGSGALNYGVLQTNGTINRLLSTTASTSNIAWISNSGFAAKGGTLTLNFSNVGTLNWGSTAGFGGAGNSAMVFGSTTSDSQVILQNNFDWNTGTLNFNHTIDVEGAPATIVGGTSNNGVSGSSALISGIMSANNAGALGNNGFVKTGPGTLILSGLNTYSGVTQVNGGTLIAGNNAAIGVAGAFGDGHTVGANAGTQLITLGGANANGGAIGGNDGTAATNSSPTVLIGGAYTVAVPVTIANIVTTGTYGIGGSTDNVATFSGLITANQSFSVTQVATTGSDALNITGGITGATAANTKTVNFANVGAVNVSTIAISNGAGTVAVTQSGAGTTTFAANNTYTGATLISGGKLRVTGDETSATGLTTVGGVSGATASTLSGTGTIGGAVTTVFANSNVGHIAPGVNTSGTNNNFGVAGTLTIKGALTIGTGTALDMDLSASSSSGNDQIVMTGSGASGLLTIGTGITVNINALGTLQLGTSSTNDYVLINGATSNNSFTASNFSAVLTGAGSTGDTANFVVVGSNLEVYFTGSSVAAAQAFVSPSPSSLKIIVGSTTTVSATLQNNAASTNPLAVSLSNSSTGGVGSVTSFSGGNPSTIAANSSATVSGTFSANAGVGAGTWGITNTDGSASPTTASTSGTVNVYNHSAATLGIASGNNQTVITGGSLNAASALLSNTAGTAPAPLDVTAASLSNLSGGTTGSLAVASGGTDTFTVTLPGTGTVGAGQTESVSLTAGDSATVVGANALSSLPATLTYNVLGHANAALSVASGNNQTIITGGSLNAVTLNLTDAGTYLSPLDVNTLSNLSGSTGTAVVANNATGAYTLTGSASATVGLNQTLATSLKAGDEQSLNGASALSTLSQNVTYSVLGHANAALSVASGNNQTIITGGSLSAVTLNLTDVGTNLSPLDVNTLSNLSGSTGTAVVANNATGAYTLTGSASATVGLNQTLATSLKAGDEQSLNGASPLSTLSQNVTYSVLGHANAALSVASGNNQSIITGGSLSAVTLNLTDVGTNLSPLDVNTLSNLSGSTGTAVVANNATGVYTLTGSASATVGLNQTLATSLKAGDEQSLNGASPLSTLSQNVTYNVYGHAAPSLDSTTLDLGYIHQGYSGTVTSNSLTATNGTGGATIVNLAGSVLTPTTDGVTLNSISGVTAGGNASITATLANGQAAESFSNQFYTFADDSSLSGASSNVLTQSITVTGQVYSGTGVWSRNSDGLWGTITGTTPDDAFKNNWGANGGAPGVTPGYTGVDTANFGVVSNTAITVSLKDATPNLNSITFSSPDTNYTLELGSGVNAGTSTGFVLSGTTPSINVTNPGSSATAGTQTISASILLGANTSVNVAANQKLILSGVISDPDESMTYTGPGTTVVTADNTYTGGTTVSGGTLYVDNSGGSTIPAHPGETVTATNPTGSGTGTGSVTVAGSGPSALATLAGSGTIAPGTGGVIINPYGSLSSGDSQAGVTASSSAEPTGTGMTLVNAGGALTSVLAVNSGDLTFALGADTTSGGAYDYNSPSLNSTYISVQGDNGNGTTSGEINFSSTGANTVSVTLLDLTATLTTNSLALRQNTPYLLIAAGLDTDYYGLVTSLNNSNATLSLDQNGFVMGVLNDTGIAALQANSNAVLTSADYDTIAINQQSQTGPLTGNEIYPVTQLYLYNGDLEVVPEPGTWALMLGGLALLVFIQQRRRNKLS